jgi:hypothetical protein
VAKSHVYFRIDRKHINTACEKNKELLKVKASGRHKVLLSSLSIVSKSGKINRRKKEVCVCVANKVGFKGTLLSFLQKFQTIPFGF